MSFIWLGLFLWKILTRQPFDRHPHVMKFPLIIRIGIAL